MRCQFTKRFTPTSQQGQGAEGAKNDKVSPRLVWGFTLIETMIAISILSIGIVAVLYMFPIGFKVEKSAQMETIAVYLAQTKMEEVISKSYDEEGMSVTTTIEDYGSIPNFNLYKRVKEISYYDPVNSTTTDDDLGIKKIEVSVFWRSDKEDIKMATFVAKR